MARYDVAVNSDLAFHTRKPPFAASDFPGPETVAIDFEGRRFVWHTVPPDPLTGQERGPTVTTMVADPNDYEAERVAMARFLSALAYATRQSIEVVSGGAAGVPAEFDPPVATALRHFGAHMHEAPAEIVVVDDDRLRLVLGYYREGLGTDSPYFRLLAFWNALEIACEDFDGKMRAWVRATMEEYPHLRGGDEPAPADWWTHFTEERRHAVAHAVRSEGRGDDLDPDDPDTRARFYRDARLFEDLVRMRVGQRWGDYAVHRRRPRE
jgi:hypothetical protein